jgi:hypothetical protein
VDSAGALQTNNLTINTTPNDTIAGSTGATFNVNYSSVQVMSNKVSKWLII